VKRTLVADIRPQAREDVDSIAGSISAGARFLDDFDAAVDASFKSPSSPKRGRRTDPTTSRRFVDL
jgi:hypothetical protein